MAGITITCVINGKSLSETVQDHEALQALIEKVLRDASATARPASEWIVRLEGTTLDHHKSLGAQGVVNGSTVFFSTGPSESGEA